MKRLWFGLIVLFIAFLFCSYSYSKKCEVCQNEYQKKHGVTTPNQAWRDFSTPIIHKDGKAYATYRCASGHKFLVCLND